MKEPMAKSIKAKTEAFLTDIKFRTKGLLPVLFILLSIDTSKIWLIAALEAAIMPIPKIPVSAWLKLVEKEPAKNIEVAAVSTKR